MSKGLVTTGVDGLKKLDIVDFRKTTKVTFKIEFGFHIQSSGKPVREIF